MKKKVWVTRDEDGMCVWSRKPFIGEWNVWNNDGFMIYDEYTWPFGNRKFGLKDGGIKQMTLEITMEDV